MGENGSSLTGMTTDDSRIENSEGKMTLADHVVIIVSMILG